MSRQQKKMIQPTHAQIRAHLKLPSWHQKKKEEEEVGNEGYKGRHFVCAAIEDGPCINKRSNIYIFFSNPTLSIISIAPSAFSHPNNLDETLKKK